VATANDLTATILALELALARGEHIVAFADRSVTYSSAAEIRDRISYFSDRLSQLQLTQGTATRSKQTFGVASKGF
jgi:hypothetical protein